jgi:conjugative transfer pilus assembly protein TraH
MCKHKRSIRITAVVLAITLLFSHTAGSTDWATDWLGNKSTTSPGYFEGQARGYVTGGSFSARWPVDNAIHPISVNAPHINAGCGGIDAFGGNVSFLEPQMMVKKLQQILQNSEGVAFEMALQTLCAPCKTIMNDMESLSSFANGLSMNSCQAAKGLVTAATGEADSMLGGMLSNAGAFSVQSGLSDSYASFQQGNMSSLFGISVPDLNSALTNNGATGQMPLRSGCTDPILSALFPDDNSKYPNMVLDVVGKDQLGLPQQYVDLMRGLVGDIQIDGETNGYRIYLVPPCPKNTSVTLTDILGGVAAAKNSSNSCSDDTTGTTINQYVSQMMVSISGKLASGTVLTNSEIDFVTKLPLPVLMALRMGVASNQQSTVISDLTEIVASYWLELSLKDLLQRTDVILGVVHDAASNLNDGGTSNGKSCNLNVEATAFKERSKEFRTQVNKVIKQLDDNLGNQFAKLKSNQDFAANLQKTTEAIKGYVSKQFGPSVSERATRLLHS